MPRLIGGNDPGARIKRMTRGLGAPVVGGLSGERLGGTFHFDTVLQQKGDDVGYVSMPAIIGNQVGCRGVIRRRRVKEHPEVGHQVLTMTDGGFDHRHGCGKVIPCALAQGQHIAIIGLDGPAAAAVSPLLGKHPDATHHAGIGRAITGIEEFEGLSGEVVHLVARQRFAAGAPEHVGPRLIGFGQVQIARRLAGHGKVIVVEALLVVVHMDLRHPVLIDPDPPLRFRVHQPHPVPVQVKPVMVGPPPRPRFGVFQVVGTDT